MTSKNISSNIRVSIKPTHILVGFVLSLCTAPVLAQSLARLCLDITQYRLGKRLLHQALPPQPFFALGFVHSVSMTPVVDFYRFNHKGDITQTLERFENHGAGLPSNVSEGTKWVETKGYFWLHMKRPISKLIVQTDKDYKNRLYLGTVSHTITHSNTIINLNQWPNQALQIAISPCSVQS